MLQGHVSRRLCTTTDEAPKQDKEKDPAVKRSRLWQMEGNFQGDLSAFHDTVMSHSSVHGTQDQGKRGKKAQRFMRLSMLKPFSFRFRISIHTLLYVNQRKQRVQRMEYFTALV